MHSKSFILCFLYDSAIPNIRHKLLKSSYLGLASSSYDYGDDEIKIIVSHF